MISRIPAISDDRLEYLAGKIRPIARFESCSNCTSSELEEEPEGDMYFVDTEGIDLRNDCFYPGPVAKERATNLRMIDGIRTYHKVDSDGDRGATVAEVLAQIPVEYLDQTIGFEFIDSGLLEYNVLEDGTFFALVRLYEKA